MTTNAPALQAPEQKSSFKTDAFPQEGMQIVTFVGYEFEKDHEFTYKGETTVRDAIRFIFAHKGEDGEWYFLRDWPQKYLFFDGGNYSAYIRALTGEPLPKTSNPEDFFGKSCMIEVKNVDLTRKSDGQTYPVTNMVGKPVTIPAMLNDKIPDPTEAMDAWSIEEARLKEAEAAYAAANADNSDEQPF